MLNIRRLDEVKYLAQEKLGLQGAAQALDEGRPIDSFTIAGFEMLTRDMQYPPQMVQMIRSEIDKRISRLDELLTELGIDTSAPQMPEPEPAAQAPPTARRK